MVSEIPEIPQNAKTEARILACVMQEPERAGDFLPLLDESLFNDLACQRILAAMKAVHVEGEEINGPSIFAKLPDDTYRLPVAQRLGLLPVEGVGCVKPGTLIGCFRHCVIFATNDPV